MPSEPPREQRCSSDASQTLRNDETKKEIDERTSVRFERTKRSDSDVRSGDPVVSDASLRRGMRTTIQAADVERSREIRSFRWNASRGSRSFRATRRATKARERQLVRFLSRRFRSLVSSVGTCDAEGVASKETLATRSGRKHRVRERSPQETRGPSLAVEIVLLDLG